LYNYFIAKIDKIKEQIGWLKVLFGLILTIITVRVINKIDELEEI